MNEIGKHFELKEEPVGPPKSCLGVSLRETGLDNGVDAWAFRSSQHTKAAA